MGVAIRTAGEADRELVVGLLDAAFQDDPVSSWVFPGKEHRRTTHPKRSDAPLPEPYGAAPHRSSAPHSSAPTHRG
ncbi:hypothetical protein ACWDRX_25415, partial [Streptomyces nigra]